MVLITLIMMMLTMPDACVDCAATVDNDDDCDNYHDSDTNFISH